MTQYITLWLGVLAFMFIGVFVSVVFFRRSPGRINKYTDLDSALFEPNHRHIH